MKITVTLDHDVAAALRNFETKGTTTRKQFINEALRRGLKDMNPQPKRREQFQTRSVDMGRVLIGSIDNIGDALAIAEGEAFK